MRPRPLHLAITLGAVALLALWLTPEEQEPSPEERAGEARIGVATAHGPAAAPSRGAALAGGVAAPTEAPLPALPASLRGTTVDGGFDLDADGHFLPTARALRLFDYFLSTLGELDLAGIRALVRAEALDALPPSEVVAVMTLFDRYVRYEDRAASAAEGAAPYEDPLTLFEGLVALQAEVFGAEDAERMFARRNALSEAALRRRAILEDEGLNAEERAEALDAVEADLPEDVRALRERLAAPTRAREEVAALRAEGANEDEVFAVRAHYFGEAAATRLAAVDTARAAWEARVADYRSARDALRANGASEDAVTALRAARFEGPELLRVKALERIEAATR